MTEKNFHSHRELSNDRKDLRGDFIFYFIQEKPSDSNFFFHIVSIRDKIWGVISFFYFIKEKLDDFPTFFHIANTYLSDQKVD